MRVLRIQAGLNMGVVRTLSTESSPASALGFFVFVLFFVVIVGFFNLFCFFSPLSSGISEPQDHAGTSQKPRSVESFPLAVQYRPVLSLTRFQKLAL